MLGLGSVGMAQELFLRTDPNLIKVYVCLGLMLGPVVLEAAWRARNPMPAVTPPGESSSQSVSP